MKFDERHAPRLHSAYTRNAAKCHEEKSSSSGVTKKTCKIVVFQQITRFCALSFCRIIVGNAKNTRKYPRFATEAFVQPLNP